VRFIILHHTVIISRHFILSSVRHHCHRIVIRYHQYCSSGPHGRPPRLPLYAGGQLCVARLVAGACVVASLRTARWPGRIVVVVLVKIKVAVVGCGYAVVALRLLCTGGQVVAGYCVHAVTVPVVRYRLVTVLLCGCQVLCVVAVGCALLCVVAALLRVC
jgi:hypothetical protein